MLFFFDLPYYLSWENRIKGKQVCYGKGYRGIFGYRGGEGSFSGFFRYDREMITRIKSIPGARWEHYGRYWHIAAARSSISRLKKVFLNQEGYDLRFPREARILRNGLILKEVTLRVIDDESRRILFQMREYMERCRFSRTTVKTYLGILVTFTEFIAPKRLADDLTGEPERFMTGYIIRRGYSGSYQNQFISAYRILVQDILRKGEQIHGGIRRPKSGLRLPNVLNKEEIRRMLKVTRNMKHRVMLGVTYACGLRCGETLRLKLTDIDSSRGMLRVNEGKGKRDRVVPIPAVLIAELREYYCECRPKVWLFEGVKPGGAYSRRSFEEVLKKSVKLAGIKKSVTLHWLRHSYATHLHESGVDIRYIQLLLGHKSTKTTEIYTHVSRRDLLQIRSPFEDL